MADISKIKLENTSYNIKDETARTNISSLDTRVTALENAVYVDVVAKGINNSGNDVTEALQELINSYNEGTTFYFQNGTYYCKDILLKNNTKIKNPKLKAELDEVLENFNNFKSEETNADKDYEKLSKLENDVQTKANKFSNPEGVAYRNYISKDIVKLVNARNDYAKKKGYENFYEMKLAEQVTGKTLDVDAYCKQFRA